MTFLGIPFDPAAQPLRLHNDAAAHDLAAAGLHVHPCDATKRPLTKWRAEASIDLEQILAWWERWPDSLPAVDLAAAGLLVIDCDRHGGPDGVAEFDALVAAHGLPEGIPVVETAGGGLHYIFRNLPDPLGNSTGGLPQGVDVRGAGGYIIAPGAILPDGRCWRAAEGSPELANAYAAGTIPEPPPWLVDLIRNKPVRPEPSPSTPTRPPGSREESYARSALDDEAAKVTGAANGGRNNTLNAAAFAAGQMVGAGWISREECSAALLTAAHSCGLPKWEAMATFKSGFNAGMKEPRGGLEDREPPAIRFDPKPREALREAPATGGSVVFDGDDTSLEPPRMLVKGLLPYTGIAFLGGQSGAGKTFVAIDLAVSLASGEPFFGRKVSERVGVMILAAEGGGTIKNRVVVARNEKAHGEILPIAWTSAVPDLSKPRELPALVEMLRGVGERFQATHGVRLGAIIIDTLAAAFGLEDENNNSEAASAIRQMHALAQALGVVVIPVHHYGKGEETGLRGASAWRAGADVVLSVLADRNQVTGKVTNRRLALAKSRDGEEGEISAFDLRFVELGKDEDGDPFGSCYVEPTRQPEAAGKEARLSRAGRAYLSAFQICVLDKGERAWPFGTEGPEVKAVDREDVRAEFYRSWPAEGDSEAKRAEARRKRFRSGELEALDRGLIATRECAGKQIVWSVKE